VTKGFKVDEDGNLVENDDDNEEECYEDEIDYEQFLLELDSLSLMTGTVPACLGF
jgi:hypothetical protein